jgi:hypothetical protein
MLRRLCTARETKLQLAASLAREQAEATEAKITSFGRQEPRVGRWGEPALEEARECDGVSWPLKAARYLARTSLAMWTILAPGRAWATSSS